MEKYKSITRCIKCGNERFTGSDKQDFCKATYVAKEAIWGKFIDEHLEITCVDCGYVWREKCADAS